MERIKKMHKLAELIAEMTDTERLTISQRRTLQGLVDELQALLDDVAVEQLDDPFTGC